MSLAAILLGLINVAIVIAILLLIGAVIIWFCSWMQIGVPANVQKGYIAVVALIGLYMIVALLLGIPTVRIIGGFHKTGATGGSVIAIPTGTAVNLHRVLGSCQNGLCISLDSNRNS